MRRSIWRCEQDGSCSADNMASIVVSAATPSGSMSAIVMGSLATGFLCKCCCCNVLPRWHAGSISSISTLCPWNACLTPELIATGDSQHIDLSSIFSVHGESSGKTSCKARCEWLATSISGPCKASQPDCCKITLILACVICCAGPNLPLFPWIGFGKRRDIQIFYLVPGPGGFA